MASCGRLAIGLPMNWPVPERGGLPTRPTQRQKAVDSVERWPLTACGFAALWGSQSWLRPACPASDEFLGASRRGTCRTRSQRTLRAPVLRICELPERRLQAGLPGKIACPTARREMPGAIAPKIEKFVGNRKGGLKGRLQAGLPATRRLTRR